MIRKVLVALDTSTRAPQVLAAATELADRFNAEMLLLRVVDDTQEFPPAAHVDYPDVLPNYLRVEATHDLRRLAFGNTRASMFPPVIESGRPWKVIVKTAERVEADLIVVGSHGYQGLDRLLGTNASHVADYARRSVLVIHEKRNAA